jgi:hypothetical protein
VTLVPKYSDHDLAEARALQRKLNAVLDSAQPGKAGAFSLLVVRQLCDRALLAIPDEPYQEKVCEIERYATDFLAAARCKGRGRGGATPGAVFQRRLILSTLDALNDRLTSLETLRRDDFVVSRTAVTQKF